MPAEGVQTRHIGEQEVGSGRIRTQPGKFSIGGEGLNIARTAQNPSPTTTPGFPVALHRRHHPPRRRRRLGGAVRRPGRRVTHGVHARLTPALAAHRRGVGRLPRPAASASVGNSQHGVLRHGDRRAVEQAVRVRVLEGVRNSGGTVRVGGRWWRSVFRVRRHDEHDQQHPQDECAHRRIVSPATHAGWPRVARSPGSSRLGGSHWCHVACQDDHALTTAHPPDARADVRTCRTRSRSSSAA